MLTSLLGCSSTCGKGKKSYVIGRKIAKEETYVSRVGGVFHDLHPAFEGGHLEEGQVGLADVVEIHWRVLPRVVAALGFLQTLRLVFDELDRHNFALGIDTLNIASRY